MEAELRTNTPVFAVTVTYGARQPLLQQVLDPSTTARLRVWWLHLRHGTARSWT